jgi:hypothetical protein
MTTRSVGAPEETKKRGTILYSVLITIADLTPLQGGPFSWDVPGVETPGSVLQPQRGKDHSIKALSSKRLYDSPTPVRA